MIPIILGLLGVPIWLLAGWILGRLWHRHVIKQVLGASPEPDVDRGRATAGTPAWRPTSTSTRNVLRAVRAVETKAGVRRISGGSVAG